MSVLFNSSLKACHPQELSLRKLRMMRKEICEVSALFLVRFWGCELAVTMKANPGEHDCFYCFRFIVFAVVVGSMYCNAVSLAEVE